MPNYEYQCQKCQVVFEKKMPMALHDEPEKDPCPECFEEQCVLQVILTAPGIGDPMRLMGVKRADAGWGDVLKKVKKAHPKGNWNNKKFEPRSGI